MRLLVLGNAQRPGVREVADELVPWLRERCHIVLYDLLQEQDLSTVEAELALVLGGDGAILRAARQMGYHQVPVLGVNLGKLGFLADLTPEGLRAVLPGVLQGQYRLTKHLMLECVVEDNHADPPTRQTFLGLNEVLVHSAPPFRLIDVDLIVDGETVSRFGGDGLIISTPVGSTAHSLSAGGPILGQELDAFVITPICPHTLTNRPVVDSADRIYQIAIRQACEGAALVIDGQHQLDLSVHHRVSVRRAPVTFTLVKVPGHSYYQTLRDKLRWGTQPNFRNEP